MLEENQSVRSKIPDTFSVLMIPHLEKVDEALSPGLTVLRWTSLNIINYIEGVRKALKELEILISQANDILEMRIEGELEKMRQVVLCELPTTEPWTVQELLDKTVVCKFIVELTFTVVLVN